MGLDNVTLTPHIAGSSNGTGPYAVELAYDNVVRYFKGEELINVVRPY